ncbi:MAG TPA: thrombospondin type 3 repeat-containing protein, partial [Fibrobacteraceae bacterium]|nr:thrombospondin type 3 repeat-containing protein [Fibrobacteraceae bacterium]
MRRKNKTILFLLGTALSSYAASALSGGVSGAGTNESAIPLPYKTLQVDAGLNYYPGAYLGFRDNSGDKVDEGGADRFDEMASIAYGIFPYWEIGLLAPYYRDQSTNGDKFCGLGDIRTSIKLNYPPYPHKAGFDVALLAQVDWPTATSAGKYGGYTRHAWYTVSGSGEDSTRNVFGSRGPTLITRMLTTANFGAIDGMIPVLLHLNWGAAFTGASSQNAFLLGGGAEITPNPIATLFWSFNSEVSITEASKSIPIFDYPFASSAGLQINFPKAHLEVYGGIHFVINNYKDTLYSAPENASEGLPQYGRFPTWGYFAGFSTTFSFQPKDKDGDGIIGDEDKCPDEAEDNDGYEDDDGCPDLDNDGDKINDTKDKCPLQPEDLDGFEDEDGCPELDNDKDNIPDSLDKCPLIPEDIDGFQDEDGCPDFDNDRDMVPDSLDKCPLKLEDQDGFQDEDGCPDLDNDNDGIPDQLDACPNQAETINGFEDGDGCPDA